MKNWHEKALWYALGTFTGGFVVKFATGIFGKR